MVLRKVLPVLLKIFAIVIIVGLGISWLALLSGMFFASPYLDFVVPGSTFFSYIGAFSLFLVIGLPLLWAALWIAKWFFNTQFSKGWMVAFGIFWGLSLMGFFLSGVMVAKEFEYGAEITKEERTLDLTTDTLDLSIVAKEYDVLFGLDDGELKITEDKLIFENLSVSIKPADGQAFEFIQVNEARGVNPEQANFLANSIRFDYQLDGSQLTLPRDIEVTKADKFRVQGVEVTLLIPEGKFIKLDQDLNGCQGDIIRKDPDNRVWRSEGNIWVMEKDGLMCVDCEQG